MTYLKSASLLRTFQIALKKSINGRFMIIPSLG